MTYNNRVKFFFCNRASLFGNFTSKTQISTQPFQDPLALRDCPANTQANFLAILGPQAPSIGDFSGFKCEITPTGTTKLSIVFGFNVHPLRLQLTST